MMGILRFAIGWLAVTLLLALLHKGLIVSPSSSTPSGVFHSGHVWCFEHIASMLWSGDWSLWTNQLAYPETVTVRFIGWCPAVISALFSPIAGPIAAYNLAFLLSSSLTAPVSVLFFRQLNPRLSLISAWSLALLVSLSPPMIGAMANGQICKAQLWLISLMGLTWVYFSRKLDAKFSLSSLVSAVLAMLLAAVCMAFTEPTYCLFVAPVLGLSSGLWILQSSYKLRQLFIQVLMVGGVAIIFVLAERYYDTTGLQSAFTPSVRLDGSGIVNQLQQQVSLYELFGFSSSEFSTTSTIHFGYVGWGNLVIVSIIFLWSLFTNWRNISLSISIALLLVGVGLSLGEYLALDETHYRPGGAFVSLPSNWLAQLGYPLAQSGQYYRGMALVWLAIPAMLSLLNGRRLQRIIPLIATGMLVFSMHRTSNAWPFPVEKIAGKRIFEQIETQPGAVLDLPSGIGNYQLGVSMRDAAIHGQPIPVIPTYLPMADHPLFRRNNQVLIEALSNGQVTQARSALLRSGYRHILWRLNRFEPRIRLETMISMFGDPVEEEGILLWTLSESGQ